MAADSVYSPQNPGADLKVQGEVGREDVTTQMRDGSRKAIPHMGLLDQATSLFMRMRGMFAGLDADGFRMGDLVVAANSSITNIWTGIQTEIEETGDLIQAVLSRIDAVKVPVDRLSILSLAYNYAAQAMQTIAVVGDPPRINGPATFWSVTAANIANGTTQYIIPCAMYARQGIHVYFTNAGGTLLQFRSYGKVDDAAWAAAGAIPAQYSIDNLWQYPAGSLVFGAAPAGGAAVYNALVARMQDPTPWNSIAIECIASASNGNTTGVGTYTLQGGTK